MNTAIIFDVKRFAVHDGDGIRTTVFFKGCPLRCRWCHNPEGLSGQIQLSYNQALCAACGRCAAVCPQGAHQMRHPAELKDAAPEMLHHVFDRSRCVACGKCTEVCPAHALRIYGRKVTAEELVAVLLEDREFYIQTGGGVTLSGGEPLLQPDFCVELLRRLKEHGVHTAVDTSGAVDRSAIEKVMPYTDIFLFDVKAHSEELHKKLTGRGNREILDNLSFLDRSGKAIEIRIPLIPHGNDGDMENIGAFLGGLRQIRKVKVLPYHHFYVPKYAALGLENPMSETAPPDAQTVENVISCLRKFGLNAVDGNE